MAAMKVPPEKPHFFKPIVPGFKHGLKIPTSYLKYLEGYDQHEHAVLRRAGNKEKEWPVKLNDWRFEEGWEKFAEEHDLQLEDVLVFRHEGDMKFEVSIFDSNTHCNRKYPENQQEEAAHITVEETSKSVKLKEKLSRRSIKSSKRGSSHAEAATDHSHFECIIQPYCLSSNYLYLPKDFATANGLTNVKKCPLIIRDERQRSWDLTLSSSKSSRVCIGGGWPKFVAGVCLKKGDCVIFEVVTNGKTPVWKFQFVTNGGETPMQKFQDLRGSPSLQPEVKKKKLPCAKRISDKDIRIKASDVTVPKSQMPASISADNANPHFISTIKPHTITNPVLVLQMPFVKSNGLMDKSKMTLVNGEGTPWPVCLGRNGRSFVIKRKGWTKFMKANGVQVGDAYKLELVDNGAIPTLYFHSIYSEKDAKKQRRH